jgi:hypothetical protein
MRGALCLGIQRTLGVVQSHYRVDIATLATGYIITDDGAEAEANRLDALAAPAANVLVDNFEEVLFLNAPPCRPPRALKIVGHSGL